MTEHPDVLILGGGVIGLTTAYCLAREGARVAVIDKGDFGQEASWAGAGILPPANPAFARSPFEQLHAQSAGLLPQLSAELRERTQIDNGYFRCGSLGLGWENESAVAQELSALGIEFQFLTDKDLHQLEPAVSPRIKQAVFLPQTAQLRNPRHLKALRVGCQLLGVVLAPGCPVHGFERRGDRIGAVLTGTGPRMADKYLLATGAWTDGLLQQLGIHAGIRPIRGQIALLQTGGPLFRRIIEHGKRYLVPRPDGRVLVGSTEEDAGFDKHTTAGAIAGLLEFARSLVPSLESAHLERCWAGLRPGSSSGSPLLGAVPGIENLFVAAGHFRSGLQLSAISGKVMAELLLGRAPSVPLESFTLDRTPR